MPSPTFDNIGSVTVTGSSQASIEFTGVSAGYDSLMIIASLRSVTGGTTDEYGMRFNDDATAGIYSQHIVYWSGGTRVSTGVFTDTAIKGIQTTASGNTTDAFSNTSILIVNYKTANLKSVFIDSNTFNQSATTLYHKYNNAYWNSANVVNKISLTGGGGNFAVNSTATLYGIKNT
jgi:hypothetical protein